MKIIETSDNVLIFHGVLSPERLVSQYLFDLSEEDCLCTNVARGYSKQVCFRDISFG